MKYFEWMNIPMMIVWIKHPYHNNISNLHSPSPNFFFKKERVHVVISSSHHKIKLCMLYSRSTIHVEINIDPCCNIFCLWLFLCLSVHKLFTETCFFCFLNNQRIFSYLKQIIIFSKKQPPPLQYIRTY